MFIAFMQGTTAPGTFLMIAAIFSLKMRGLMVGASPFVLWVVNAIIQLVSPPVAALGFGTFLAFAAVGVFAIWLVATAVPETRGHTLARLEEIPHSLELSWARIRGPTNAPGGVASTIKTLFDACFRVAWGCRRAPVGTGFALIVRIGGLIVPTGPDVEARWGCAR